MATLTPDVLALAQMVPVPLTPGGGIFGVIAIILGCLFAAIVLYWAVVAVFKGVGWAFHTVGRLFAHLFACVGGVIAETVRALGSVITALLLLPLALFNVAVGRWSASSHFVRAAQGEFASAGLSLYRAVVGWPLRLVGLGFTLEGFEARLVEVVTRAPRGGGKGLDFEGYTILSALPQGGSGAQLFLARPSAEHVRQLADQGVALPERVVIKAFGLNFGSSLPQMMRENRALEAARRMGLVFEHRSEGDRFYYVMPYVPGSDLGIVTHRLHEASGAAGLSNEALQAVIGYSNRLLAILGRFHEAGVWHKDIKPSNIVVNGDAVELIDLGLVTPLASAMTLTTHGTEYYRDPELVRQAMRGVKVHEVDGVKFDLYSTGAVIYSMIEDSFPAHGSLSRITKRCPEALSWIVRRAMAESRQRYSSAAEMHADLAKLASASDPFAVRPADLPSMGGTGVELPPLADRPTSLPSRSGPPPLPSERRRMAKDADRRRRIEERDAKRHVRHEQRLQRSGGGLRAFGMVMALFFVIMTYALFTIQPGGPVPTPDAPAHVYMRGNEVARASRGGQAAEAPPAPSLARSIEVADGDRPIVLILSELPRELLSTSERERLADVSHLVREHLGWRVVSESSTDALPEVDTDELIADLRGAALMAEVGDELSGERIQAYLDAGDALDAVLWVGFEEDRIARHSLMLDPDSKRFPRRLIERRGLARSLGNLLE